MPIHREHVAAMLLDAVPSFHTIWENEVRRGNEDGAGRLHYLDASAFVRHLIHRWQAGAVEDVRRAFDVIERLHVQVDVYVRELATIGFLEDIQNGAASAGISADEFTGYLGPESLRWWNGLNAFWSGVAPAVLPMDGPVDDA